MTTLQTAGLAITVLTLLYISSKLSWSSLLHNKQQQHVVFGYTALLFFLWIFRAVIYPGLDVHFLWLTAMCLTLGFRWSMLAGCVALLGTTLVGLNTWAMFGVNAVCSVFVPVGITYLIFMSAFHKIPRNLFVYIFVCAFFPAALVIALKMSLLSSYYFVEGIYSWDVIRDNYFILIPLLLFPEGLLNGITMTLLIIYKPEWVHTFHDKFYIDGK